MSERTLDTLQAYWSARFSTALHQMYIQIKTNPISEWIFSVSEKLQLQNQISHFGVSERIYDIFTAKLLFYFGAFWHKFVAAHLYDRQQCCRRVSTNIDCIIKCDICACACTCVCSYTYMESLVNVFAAYTNHTRYLNSACVSSSVFHFRSNQCYYGVIAFMFCTWKRK